MTLDEWGITDSAEPSTQELLAIENRRRCDLEGELRADLVNGLYVLTVDSARVVDLLTYYFKPETDKQETRLLGRCRLTVELLSE